MANLPYSDASAGVGGLAYIPNLHPTRIGRVVQATKMVRAGRWVKKKAQRASHSLVACAPVGDAHECLLCAPSARRAMARVGEARDARRGAVWGCAVNLPFFEEGGEGCTLGVPARRVAACAVNLPLL